MLLSVFVCFPSGSDRHCSHMVGLIKALQLIKLHNLKTVPAQQSHKTRGPNIRPVQVMSLVLAQPKKDRKLKPIVR